MKTKDFWKVGELAKQTGLSIRTLHYYDEIGLLVPSHYTETGHRLYTKTDIARLQQILSLRHLGFSLNEIKDCLLNPYFEPRNVIRLHMDRLRKQIDLQNQIYKRLEKIEEYLESKKEITVEQFIKTIEVMIMSEKYEFTPEQMEKIKEQGEKLGKEKIREVENEWPELIAKVRVEMEKGTPPTSIEVRQLAKRWNELVNMFTGGDSGIHQTLQRRYNENPDYAAKVGLDPEIFAYISKAMPNKNE